MKKKAKVQPPIKTAEMQRLENLIDLAVDKYGIENVVFAFIERNNHWSDRTPVIKELLKDENYREDLHSELEEEYKRGKVFIPVESLAEEMKIMELVSGSGILAPYNQTQLFA